MNKALDIKCPGCGCKITYNPVIGKFKCTHCNGEFNIEDIKVKNYKNDNFLKYKCNNCGAEITLDDTTASTECLYCGNTAIIKERLTGEFRPDFIVPFRTTKEQIYKQFEILEKNDSQIDSDFIKKMKIKKITPVYVPFFLYSFNLSSRITYMNEVRTNPVMGFTETKARIELNNVPIDGSVALDDDIMATLFPYDLDDKLEYNDAFLSGWHAEMYDEPRKKITDKLIKQAKLLIRRYFSLKKDATYVAIDNPLITQKEIKYMLLPVWIVDVEHDKQIIKFYMNGQTNEMVAKTNYNTNYFDYRLIGFPLYFIYTMLMTGEIIPYNPLSFIIGIILFIIIPYGMLNKSKILVKKDESFRMLEDISVVKEELYK